MNAFLGAPEGMEPHLDKLRESRRNLENQGDYVKRVTTHSRQLRNIIAGQDSRKILLTGPCSIHDLSVGRRVIDQIAKLQEGIAEEYKIICRIFGEKPRTTNLDTNGNLNWRGYIAHPNYDVETRSDVLNTETSIYDMNELMLHALDRDLAVGTEFLSSENAALLGPLVSYVQVGARSLQPDYIARHISQLRELCKYTSCVAGIKNPENGLLDLPRDVIRQLNEINGENSSFLIMRGSLSGQNWEQDPNTGYIDAVAYMIDAGHDNCKINGKKSHEESERVLNSLINSHRLQTDSNLIGITVESHINSGCQSGVIDVSRDQSLTDPCVTVKFLQDLLSN